jgi:chromosome segregation ATPase
VIVTTELPVSLTSAIATEIERAAASARAEIESKLVQAQTEAAELANVGETLEAERDELIEQVAGLTTERDTLAGKAEQQAADIKAQAERIEREQQAAEAARVELARAQLKIESSVEKLADQATEVQQLRATLDTETKSRIAAEQQAAVLTAKLEAMRDRATDIETRTAAEITALKAERQEIPTLLKTLMDKIGTVKTNNLAPNVDRQNVDLFSDDNLENTKPTAPPVKRRKTAK